MKSIAVSPNTLLNRAGFAAMRHLYLIFGIAATALGAYVVLALIE